MSETQKTTLLERKKSAKKNIKKLFPSGKTEYIIAVSIVDESLRAFVIHGLHALHIAVIVLEQDLASDDALSLSRDRLSDEEKLALDALIWDDLSESVSVSDMTPFGVVPILPMDNTFSSILSQFDPIEFQGNAFLYNEMNGYHIFAAFVAYLQTIQFPADRQLLLKNVSGTFM